MHTHRAGTWVRVAQSCSAQPVVNTTIGERIAPTTVIVTIVTATHMLPTCVGHPQNLLLPHPHSLLFAFIVVVQSIGQWSAETVLETTERKVAYPVQHPVGTPETDNENPPQRLVTVHKSPMLGPKIVKKLGPLVTNHRDLRQADNTSNNHNTPHRANQIIKIIFLTGIIGTVISRDKHVSMRGRIKCILHITLPLSPALSAGSDLLSHSIMQLAEMQSRSLEIFVAQQKSQIEVYQELTRSNKEKEHDALFTSIPIFDGDRTQCEQWLDDMDQATRISGRDLRTELIKKSTGVVRQVIMMAHPDASDDDLINIIREDFSDVPTMNEAREELLHMRQKPEEQMCVYVYRYGRMHQRSSGIRAAEETHQHVIQDFIKSLKPKIKNKFANKFAEGRFQPRTLDHAFSLVLDLEKKIQIANSFRDDIMDSRTPAMVNEVQSHPLDETRAINEISSNSSYRNNNSKGNYNGKPWHQRGDSKSWQNTDIKNWQNKDSRSWQNKDKKSWQNNNKNKSDKPRDTCFTLSQDQKFFAPADCDENTFQIICTLVKVQIDKAKQSGSNSKEINEISKDTLVNLLNISDETYDAAQSAIQQAEKDEISSPSSPTD